jgi:hypothetical protein
MSISYNFPLLAVDEAFTAAIARIDRSYVSLVDTSVNANGVTSATYRVILTDYLAETTVKVSIFPAKGKEPKNISVKLSTKVKVTDSVSELSTYKTFTTTITLSDYAQVGIVDAGDVANIIMCAFTFLIPGVSGTTVPAYTALETLQNNVADIADAVVA